MSRYIPSGVSKVVFAPSVSSAAAPTQAEITAGTVLTVAGSTAAAGLVEMSGWETAPSDVEVPDVASRFTGKIPGRTSASDASVTFYDDDATLTIRTALAEGTAGYMIIMRKGGTTGYPSEVYPCKVNALNSSQITSANEPAKFVASFSITSSPTKVGVIAA